MRRLCRAQHGLATLLAGALVSLDEPDVERTSTNDDRGQMLEHVLGNLRREPDERVVVADIDAIDLTAVEIALVSQRADVEEQEPVQEREIGRAHV